LNNEGTVCVIACGTLKDELSLVMEKQNLALPVVWIESGTHVQPDKLRQAVQEAIDVLPAEYATVLLLFGFCGNAMVGLCAGNRTLVLPRVADCIPLFIGSGKERAAHGAAAYFFTSGYFNSRGSIAAETRRTIERYGEEQGLSIMKEMLGNYRCFAVIDTGAFDTAGLCGKVGEFAKPFGIPVKLIPGKLRLIEMLVSGEWTDDEFLCVQPGGSITFEDTPENFRQLPG